MRSYQHISDTNAARTLEEYTTHTFADLKALQQQLSRKLLSLPNFEPPPNLVRFVRQLQNEAHLFVPANIPLYAEINRLRYEYSRLSESIGERSATYAQAGGTWNWDAWSQKYHQLWLEERDHINTLFFQLLQVRRQIAHNAGFPNYLEYSWRELRRLGSTPADHQALHAAIETEVVPLLLPRKAAGEQVREGPPALAPEILLDAAANILRNVDPDIASFFQLLRTRNFIDVGDRPDKAPVNEEWLFPKTGLPFLMMGNDLFTLIHEFGHGYHEYTSLQQQKFYWNITATEEFEEFAAMSMMMLSYPYLEQQVGGAFTPTDAALLRTNNLVLCLHCLPEHAMNDAFQHWIYGAAPADVRPEDLDNKWRELQQRYLPWEDWSGRTDTLLTGWQRDQWSLFGQPFYMISYAIAVLGAFQILYNSQSDYPATVAAYKKALALGFSRPVPELFHTAGVEFPFTPQTIRHLTTFVTNYLDTHPI